MDDMVDVGCLMLATMTPELQKQHKDMVAYEMIQNLKEIYEGQARQERYKTSKALFQCKMSEGSPVGAHVIKMMGYIQTLEKLDFPPNYELAIDVVLQSLPDSFNQFVLNFNMNEINKNLPQLVGILQTAESNMKKGGYKSILMVREARGKGKKVAKSMGIGKTKPKVKNALKPKGRISKEGKCFNCNKLGHWKRNYHVYLEEFKKAKAVGASVSGIYPPPLWAHQHRRCRSSQRRPPPSPVTIPAKRDHHRKAPAVLYAFLRLVSPKTAPMATKMASTARLHRRRPPVSFFDEPKPPFESPQLPLPPHRLIFLRRGPIHHEKWLKSHDR
ncbi:hypothetical protein GQ457_01G019000 [Hibiscus cannabinus]